MESCLQFTDVGFNHEAVMALCGLQLGKVSNNSGYKHRTLYYRSSQLKKCPYKNQLAMSIFIALSFYNSYHLKCLAFNICISVLISSFLKIQKPSTLLPFRCPGKSQFIQVCQGMVEPMRNFQIFLGSLT